MSIIWGFCSGTQTVTNNSTHIYNVGADANLEFTWTVEHTDGTLLTSTDGTANDHSITIDWSKEGVWTITVKAKDKTTLCYTEPQTATITVVGAGTANFAAASGSVVTCSDLDGGLPGGLLDESLFALDLKGGVSPYDVTYEVLDASNSVVQASKTVTGVADGDDITITNDFVNTTGGDEVYTVVITGVKTSDGVDVVLGADVTRTITVHTKPTISGTITLN